MINHVGKNDRLVKTDFSSGQVAPGLANDLFREDLFIFRIDLKVTNSYLTDNEKSPVKKKKLINLLEIDFCSHRSCKLP